MEPEPEEEAGPTRPAGEEEEEEEETRPVRDGCTGEPADCSASGGYDPSDQCR